MVYVIHYFLYKFIVILILIWYNKFVYNKERIGDASMKAATGELNLTVITLIAIGAVIGFFWLMWPKIQESINTQWDNISQFEDK